MYPRAELDRLEMRKALLQARIGVRRFQCAEHAAGFARPLRAIDNLTARWHQVSPWMKLVGIPLGVIAGRRMSKRGQDGKLSAFLKYVPIALQTMKLLTKARQNAKARAKAEAQTVL